jgi:acyl-CoA thioester hydrolase
LSPEQTLNPEPAFRYAKRIEIRFRDCDPLGHVNNAVYATYFEMARFAYWREALGYTSADGFSFIMARIECNYRSQVRAGESLDVGIRVGRIGRSSFTFDYLVTESESGRVVADGNSVQVMYDYAAQRSRPVSDVFRARVGAFEQRDFAAEAGTGSPAEVFSETTRRP